MKPPVPSDGTPLCICRCKRCFEFEKLEAAEEEKQWADELLEMLEKQSTPVGLTKEDARVSSEDCLDLDTMTQVSVTEGCYPTSTTLRGLSAPEVEEGPVSGPQETAGYPRFGLGSKYWEHFPASDQLNPAGFFSPHPLWESFAKPAKVGKKNAFHCEFCKKTFIGAADKGVNHMLKKKGCLIPDVNKQALVDKLAAYRKRKQEHMKRRKPEKN